MTLKEGDEVRLRAEVTGIEGVRIPVGTVGVVVEAYSDPEAYAVDVTVDDEPDNVYVSADKVEPVASPTS